MALKYKAVHHSSQRRNHSNIQTAQLFQKTTVPIICTIDLITGRRRRLLTTTINSILFLLSSPPLQCVHCFLSLNTGKGHRSVIDYFEFLWRRKKKKEKFFFSSSDAIVIPREASWCMWVVRRRYHLDPGLKKLQHKAHKVHSTRHHPLVHHHL